MGNKFLSHIREVDAIIHLVRCFDSDQITHVNSSINPLDDLETINTEIILSDIDIIQKKLEKNKKKLLNSNEIKVLENKLKALDQGEDRLNIDDVKEVNILKGDNQKAKKILKWKPETDLDGLISIMVQSELKNKSK